MAGVSQDQGDELNVELNLVPFIDLLSSLVVFLLLTAVWLQVSTIPASVDSKGRSSVTTAPQTRMQVHVNERGYKITWPAKAQGMNLPGGLNKNPDGTYPKERLVELIAPVYQKQAFGSVVVSADDLIDYGLVVQTIDGVKAAGVPSVALSTE